MEKQNIHQTDEQLAQELAIPREEVVLAMDWPRSCAKAGAASWAVSSSPW